MSEKSAKEVTKRLDSEEYVLRKRLPNHLPKRDIDFYVNMRTNFGTQLKRCQHALDSLDSDSDHIVVHGLAKAINRAINLSLQLKDMNHLEMTCNTSSVDMIDDMEPIGDSRDLNDSFIQKRTVSAIHIKLSRKQHINT
ncbi:unnamed protein product [Medioppia subpectinata]|uniref:Ribonuclease P protein subunit p20 n=1 Tax=Medioppia subpectinata TaxID=1979941 RepID=A0A7R9KWJ1_9ACAR|nr:unnamed protein product [Medioppia subpectinata]CAG2111154.1 unnamed protein product [Medioppia subpectinata]